MTVNPLPIRFLIVDDDEDDQEILSTAISRSIVVNNTFSFAADGEEALTMLNMDPLPDYIFLDLNMPRMNGMQCLTEIKSVAALQHIPVVIYTTSSDESAKTIAIRIGATAFISKPTRMSDLVSHLNNFFAEQTPIQAV